MTHYRSTCQLTRALALISVMGAIGAQAQTFTTLANFDGSNGGYPEYVSLIQAIDGNLYGTTSQGGIYAYGTIFQITLGGTLTDPYSFNYPTPGYAPHAGLLQTADGSFYGTTYAGGDQTGYGTVFRMAQDGSLSTLHVFDLSDGAYPIAPLVLGFDGNLYGTTSRGGRFQNGTVFRITPGGTLTTLHHFSGADGAVPAGLVQADDGAFYGIAFSGGNSLCFKPHEGCGTVFKITASGELTTLHKFAFTDGGHPVGTLVEAYDGDLYGVTFEGGAYLDGTIFRITTSGVLNTLHSLGADSTEGWHALAGLIQATDGNFYGTTRYGPGADSGAGTIFQVTAGGTFTTLHTFDFLTGANPYGGLMQDTSGALYGTTNTGGPASAGSVFRYSLGLGDFVRSVPSFGHAGSEIVILGMDLTGASSVSFNGTNAEFKLTSPSALKAVVPQGATTGIVQIVKPGATLSSNAAFQVLY